MTVDHSKPGRSDDDVSDNDFDGAPADDEVHAVRAHLALNCSAVVVAGIEMLKDHWPRLTLADRATLLSRVYDNARSVDDALRLMIVGGPA